MLTLLVMLLTAINYQNNLVYGVTFWLSMVFIVTVHFTHGNLMGLVLQRRGGCPSLLASVPSLLFACYPAKGRVTGLSVSAGRDLRFFRMYWVSSRLIYRSFSLQDSVAGILQVASR